MDKKPYLILITSQKGGVGKTTVALNLAVALTYKNYKVLLVDSDTQSASASGQLGIPVDGNGYEDAVRGDAELEDIVFAYEPIDMHIIPAGSSKEVLEPEPEDLVKFYAKLTKLNYDFIIVDSPPGLFNGGIAKFINSVAILTTPDPVSSASSSRMAAFCEKYKLEHKLIINRVGYSKYDLEKEEVERLYRDIALQIIPEDTLVAESISKHKPAYMIDRGSYFSLAIDDLARAYALKVDTSAQNRESEIERKTPPSFFQWLAGWFLRSK